MSRSTNTASGFAFSTVGELAGDNNTGKPSFDYDRGGQQISREDRKWDGDAFGSSATVTFSYLSDSQADNGFRELTAAQKRTTEDAFDMWSAVANIDFRPAGGGNNVSDRGDIVLQGYNGGGGGWASWSLRGGGATDQITSATIALGGNDLSLSLHEVGHAIGLSHPGRYNGGGNSYERDAEFYQDSEQYTVMSYWSGSKTGADLNGATGLGLYDIAAIQRLYGANEDTYTNNTVYGFNSNTRDSGWTLNGQNDWIQAAIWDAGGKDTIDMSGYSSGSDIDLREEAFSSTGGLKYNLAIAKGAVIENAIGGSGNDTIRGNDVRNVLEGNGGRDTLHGEGGRDRLDGGGGADRLSGGNGVDILKGGNGRDFLDGDGGRVDILYGGASADKFHFDRGDGRDRIKDFQDNIDTLQFDNFGFLDNASDALDFARTRGDDVLFDFGSNGFVIVEDIQLNQLTNDIEIV